LYKKILSCLAASVLLSKNAFSVNVVAWINFIKPEVILELENECNTKVSVDGYYATDEFLKKMKQFKYDVGIFSSEIYDVIENKIDASSDHFKILKQNYHPNINTLFKKQIFFNKTGLFSLTTTGFLYNPNVIQISENNSISEIFAKAHGKEVSIIDEPIESFKLISKGKRATEANITSESVLQLQQLVAGTRPLITNDTKAIVKKENFAFSYTWSGVAFMRIRENPHLKFIHHPDLTYASADLIAPFSADAKVLCVAKKLASKRYIDKSMAYVHFFSPYEVPTNFVHREYQTVHRTFLDDYNSLKWLEDLNNNEYARLNKVWSQFKVAIR
jgi:hypothetical protein